MPALEALCKLSVVSVNEGKKCITVVSQRGEKHAEKKMYKERGGGKTAGVSRGWGCEGSEVKSLLTC